MERGNVNARRGDPQGKEVMSLKALKTVVDALREGSSQSCGRMDGCWACTDMENVNRAEAEIAALEKAARHFVDQNLYQTLAVSDDFEVLMESIAKEAG